MNGMSEWVEWVFFAAFKTYTNTPSSIASGTLFPPALAVVSPGGIPEAAVFTARQTSTIVNFVDMLTTVRAQAFIVDVGVVLSSGKGSVATGTCVNLVARFVSYIRPCSPGMPEQASD